MPKTQTTYVYTDPRYFEGDPFEVADKATAQAAAALELSDRAVADADVMARNAELERHLYAGNDPDAVGWPASPQGRRFRALRGEIAQHLRELATLRRAASFNPRRPPREES